VSLLRSAPGIQCFDEEWNSWLGLVVLFLALDVILLPIAVIFLIHRNQKSIHAGVAEFATKWGFAFEMYSAKTLWWEATVLVRRAVFVLLDVLLAPESKAGGFGLFTLALLLSQLYLQPFRRPFDNKLELGSLVVILVTSLLLSTEETLTPSQYSDGLQVLLSVLVLVPTLLFSALLILQKLGYFRKTDNPNNEIYPSGKADASRHPQLELAQSSA
jgi:hypothetical protein